MVKFIQRLMYSLLVPVLLVVALVLFTIDKLVNYIPGWMIWVATGKVKIKITLFMNFLALHDYYYWKVFNVWSDNEIKAMYPENMSRPMTEVEKEEKIKEQRVEGGHDGK